jgi:mono/diheme cytochrome c family protein
MRRDSDGPALERSLDRQMMLGLVFGALLFAGFPLYAFREPDRLKRAAAEQREEYARIGEEQYALHCAACHGVEGSGGGLAPTLRAREFLSQVSDQQLQWLIAGGVPGTTMSPYHIDLGGPFTDQHVEQVAVYLRTLEEDAPAVPGWRDGALAPPRVRPAPASAGATEGEPEVAQVAAAPTGSSTEPEMADADQARPDTLSAKLYAQRCAACHGARGEGVPNLGAAILTPEYLKTRTDTALVRLIANGVPGTAMMAFEQAKGGGLSRAQIQALVRWMRTEGARHR